jgi:hypothetical protein
MRKWPHRHLYPRFLYMNTSVKVYWNFYRKLLKQTSSEIPNFFELEMSRKDSHIYNKAYIIHRITKCSMRWCYLEVRYEVSFVKLAAKHRFGHTIQLDFERFWRWCMLYRTIRFILDFIHRLLLPLHLLVLLWSLVLFREVAQVAWFFIYIFNYKSFIFLPSFLT